MKKLILATTIIGLSMGGALAQTSQPQGGANQSPTSPTNSMDKDGMKGTSGMSKDSMSKDGMAKDGMTDKSKENKPVDGMKK